MSRLAAKLVPHDPEIDTDILLEVGRIVSYWGRIEHTIDSNIRAMWHTQASAGLRKQMPNYFRDRLKLWVDLCHIIWPPPSNYLVRAEGLRAKLSEAAPKRQKIVHGYWAVRSGARKQIRISARKDKKGRIIYEEITLSSDDLKLEAESLRAHYLELTGLSIIILIHSRFLPHE